MSYVILKRGIMGKLACGAFYTVAIYVTSFYPALLFIRFPYTSQFLMTAKEIRSAIETRFILKA